MIYGGGEDSQPFPDLPRHAIYPAGTLNAALSISSRRRCCGSPTPTRLADETFELGHMYNAVIRTPLKGQVDALFYLPRVSPMRASASNVTAS